MSYVVAIAVSWNVILDRNQHKVYENSVVDNLLYTGLIKQVAQNPRSIIAQMFWDCKGQFPVFCQSPRQTPNLLLVGSGDPVYNTIMSDFSQRPRRFDGVNRDTE
jgi:hypothetical protein